METESIVTDEERLSGRIWAALAYLNVIFLIAAYLLRGKNRLVSYHGKQAIAFFVLRWLGGLVLLVGLKADLSKSLTIIWVFGFILTMLAFLIAGISNAWRGRLAPLPIIGKAMGAFIEAGMGNSKTRQRN